jgi:hypothetical protein
MTVRRGIAFGLAGTAIVTAGFLIGSSLGEDPEEAGFGSSPVTLTTGKSDVRVPSYASGQGPPALAVTTTEVATTETGEADSGSESATEPIVGGKSEEKPSATTPTPKSPQQDEPDITVGEEEE